MHLDSVPKIIIRTRERIVNKIERANAKAGPRFGHSHASNSSSAPELLLLTPKRDETFHRRRSASYVPSVPDALVHVPRIVVPRPTKPAHHKSIFVEHFEIDVFDCELAGLTYHASASEPIRGCGTTALETPISHSNDVEMREPSDEHVKTGGYNALVRTIDEALIGVKIADETSSVASEGNTYSAIVTEAIMITITKVKPTLIHQRSIVQVHRSNAVLRVRKLSGGIQGEETMQE